MALVQTAPVDLLAQELSLLLEGSTDLLTISGGYGGDIHGGGNVEEGEEDDVEGNVEHGK